jgi:PBP1b-binding outer membrane lipoprotein LpoB
MVIVGTIKNNSHEHINPDLFVASLQKALINSGKVDFVANKFERDEVREERLDQLSGNTELSTISEKGHETGADFMLKGSINSIQDAVEGKFVMFYQVNLELIDMKTNQKRWLGQKEIKKLVRKSGFSL